MDARMQNLGDSVFLYTPPPHKSIIAVDIILVLQGAHIGHPVQKVIFSVAHNIWLILLHELKLHPIAHCTSVLKL